jgi:hypothetical protein
LVSRKSVDHQIEPVGKNFLIGPGCLAEKAVLGCPGYMIQACPNLTGEKVIGEVKIRFLDVSSELTLNCL